MDIILRLYAAVKAQIETNPNVKTVDWYNEQYQNTEKENPRAYPAVYIEFIDPIEFTDASNKMQHTSAKILLHCVTNYLTDSPEAALNFSQWIAGTLNGKDLFTTIGETPAQLTTKLVRQNVSMPKRYKNLKVVKIQFICEAYDQSLMDQPEFAENIGFVVNA